MEEAESVWSAGDVKRRLQRFREQEREIDYQMERLERYSARLTDAGGRPLTDMPPSRSGSPDRLTEYLIRIEDLENDIREKMRTQAEEKSRLENVLDRVSSARERAVIRMRYFDGCAWADILPVLYGEQEDYAERREAYLRRVHKLHGAALASMARILDTETD